MKITWGDVGRAQVAGEYPVGMSVVVVKAQHIAVWQSYPTAVFSTGFPVPGRARRTLTLTRWLVPAG